MHICVHKMKGCKQGTQKVTIVNNFLGMKPKSRLEVGIKQAKGKEEKGTENSSSGRASG